MAIVTSAEQLAGPHLAIYEEFWSVADSKKVGTISAQDAAGFMKQSGLSDIILSKIWELCDSDSRGVLDRRGFFSALKLIALVQSGQEASLGNLALSCPPPKVGSVSRSRNTSGGWRIGTSEKSKYDETFNSLQPVNGKLPGDKVKPVLMNSNLPVDTLGKIWELSDIDKDGCLDNEEFALAMHLIYQSLNKNLPPASLPPDLVPPSHRSGFVRQLNTGSSVSSDVQFSHNISSAPTLSLVQSEHTDEPGDTQEIEPAWVVSHQMKSMCDQRFDILDKDLDGLINGGELREIFLQSGLNQQTLANIWGLCDQHNSGSLNKEQFALAMYLIEEKKTKNIEPPPRLTPDMIPPSSRGKLDHGVKFEPSKALMSIEAEIEDFKRQTMILEGDKQQKEADLRIKSGEVQTFQKEYESIYNTVVQLEKQKGEAQKRLDEMEDQKNKLDVDVNELKEKCTTKQLEIDSIREQTLQHERGEKDRETELVRLKEEFYEVHSEEKRLEQEILDSKQKIEKYKHTQHSNQTESETVKAQIESMKMKNELLEKLILTFSALISGTEDKEPTEQEISSALQTLEFTPTFTTNGDAFASKPAQSDAFEGFDAFSSTKTNGFGSTDPFADMLKANTKSAFETDPFNSTADPFKSKTEDAFPSSKDPFGNSDPFSSSDPFAQSGADPFGNTGGATADPFAGSDPFYSEEKSTKTFDSLFPDNQLGSSDRPKSTDPFGGGNDVFGSLQPVRPASAAPTSNSTAQSSNSNVFDPFSNTSTMTNTNNQIDSTFGFDPFSNNSSTSPSMKKKGPPRPALPRPKAATPTGDSKKQITINPDPFKMSTKGKKTPRPKAVTPKEAPFDPFAASDQFASKDSNKKFTADFSNAFEPAGFSSQDIAWGNDEEARKRQEQEKNDYAYALQLSRQQT